MSKNMNFQLMEKARWHVLATTVCIGSMFSSVSLTTSAATNENIASSMHSNSMESAELSVLPMSQDLTGSTEVDKNNVIKIPDSNLKIELNKLLGNQEGEEITQGELERITDLQIIGKNIQSLAGLEYAVNLETLYLNYNEINDISVLRNLTKLSKLALAHNRISDISALSDLTNLTELYLHTNQISNVSALSKLTNLSVLYLYENQISDISDLGSLTNVTRLTLGDNKISDISVLSHLTKLKELYLYNNQISNISGFNNLIDLTDLALHDNQISDMSALSNLTKLKNLYLHNNQITDISALINSTNLVTLQVKNNQIEDINVLGKLTNLEDLDLSDNQVKDVSVLDSLSKLKFLRLNDNQIKDISALTNLIKLSGLYLNNNQIGDLSSLSHLTNLSSLSLNNNQVSDLSPLRNLTNLTEFSATDQKISLPDVVAAVDTAKIANPLKLITGERVDLTALPSNVTYDSTSGVITFSGISSPITTDIKFSDYVWLEDGKFIGMFSGTFSQKITPQQSAPVISASDLTINVGDTFDPLKGVSARNSAGEEIILTLANVIENKVDTTQEGTYRVVYEVTDDKGASVQKVIQVTVVGTGESNPTLPGTPEQPEYTMPESIKDLLNLSIVSPVSGDATQQNPLVLTITNQATKESVSQMINSFKDYTVKVNRLNQRAASSYSVELSNNQATHYLVFNVEPTQTDVIEYLDSLVNQIENVTPDNGIGNETPNNGVGNETPNNQNNNVLPESSKPQTGMNMNVPLILGGVIITLSGGWLVLNNRRK